MVTQHADSLAATAREKEGKDINKFLLASSVSCLLFPVRIFHVAVRAVDRNAPEASSQVCADFIVIATDSRRLLALIDV